MHFKGSSQVRPDQGREKAEWHQSQEHRGVPKALLDPKVHKGPGLVNIPKLIAKHKEQQELEEKRLKAQASLLDNPMGPPAEEAAPAQPVAEETKEELEEDESEGDNIIEHIPRNCSELKRRAGARERRPEEVEERKALGVDHRHCHTHTPAEAALDAASVVSGVTRLSGELDGIGKQLPGEQAASKARTWVTTIDVGAMLDGKSHVWSQWRRSKTSLRRAFHCVLTWTWPIWPRT